MKADLKEMLGGAVQAKFAHSFEKVMENLLDPNTPYKDKREINIKMKFVQNEMRDNVLVEVNVTEKLASQGGLATQFEIGKDLRTGKIYAEEYGKQLKGQFAMDMTELDPAPNVNRETGEILDNASDEKTVVDFRKAQGE